MLHISTLAPNDEPFQALTPVWRDEMEPIYANLAAALRERIAIIRDEESRRMPEAHLIRLQKVSEKIDALQRALPTTADPRLNHFLQRRSYDKALEYLQDMQKRPA